MGFLVYGINAKKIGNDSILKIVSGYDAYLPMLCEKMKSVKIDGLETTVFSTCLRYELFIYFPDKAPKFNAICLNKIKAVLRAFFCRIMALNGFNFSEKDCFSLSGVGAIEHIYSVMSGFESEDIGEIQVLCQIKKSYDMCRRSGLCANVMKRIMSGGIACASKIRDKAPVFMDKNILIKSVVKKIHSYYGDKGLLKKKVFIAGKSRTSSMIAERLRQIGVVTVDIYGDSYERAVKKLVNYDILIFNVSDIGYAADLTSVAGGTNCRLVIDLSIFRNVDHSFGECEAIEIVTIDELIPFKWSDASKDSRRADNVDFSGLARGIVIKEAGKIVEMIKKSDISPDLSGLIKNQIAIIEAEFAKTFPEKLPAEFAKKIESVKKALIKKIPALIVKSRI